VTKIFQLYFFWQSGTLSADQKRTDLKSFLLTIVESFADISWQQTLKKPHDFLNFRRCCKQLPALRGIPSCCLSLEKMPIAGEAFAASAFDKSDVYRSALLTNLSVFGCVEL